MHEISTYILESVECNMCEWQIKICDAYDKICTKQRTCVLIGQHRSYKCHWPVRPVSSIQNTTLGDTSQTGAQVQPGHKARNVRAIWAKMIRLGLQANLEHFALWRPRFSAGLPNPNDPVNSVEFGQTTVNLGHHLENITNDP
jgi:hypothetical protein